MTTLTTEARERLRKAVEDRANAALRDAEIGWRRDGRSLDERIVDEREFATMRHVTLNDLQAALAYIGELEAALKPFADTLWPDTCPDDQRGNTSLVTVGEYRRARRVLTPAGGGGA